MYVLTSDCKKLLTNKKCANKITAQENIAFKIKAVKETKKSFAVLFNNNSFAFTFIKPLINNHQKNRIAKILCNPSFDYKSDFKRFKVDNIL